MTNESDIENQRAGADEETPLLRSDGRQPVDSAPDAEPDSAEFSDQTSPPPEEDKKRERRFSWYFWRIFWFIVAVLIIAVFVKGWVDAGGDVDVRRLVPVQNKTGVLELTISVHSSTWELR